MRIQIGDARDVLTTLPDQSVQTCVTSPPYFGLRDYGTASWDGGDPDCDHVADPTKTKKFGNPVFNESRPSREATKTDGYYFKDSCPKCGAVRVDNQIGLEATVDEYVSNLVDVFREVRRVLKDDGTCWVNLGDSYASAWPSNRRNVVGSGSLENGKRENRPPRMPDGLKEKDLIGIPWRVAFALQADGWYLRQDIIWSKPNPMPESVRDRCTKSHEYLFLLSKGPRYYYDASAIAEDAVAAGKIPGGNRKVDASRHDAGRDMTIPVSETRNRRSVWSVATQPFSDWIETSRQVRVSLDEADDDTTRIPSRDCPVHAFEDQPHPIRVGDERAVGSLSRTSGNDSHRAPVPAFGSVPTGPNRAGDSATDSLDSLPLLRSHSANGHSSQSHKTGHDPATSQTYTPSGETSGHTDGTSVQRESAAPHHDTNGSSISADDCGDNPSPETTPHTADSSPEHHSCEACTCSYEKTTTESISHFAVFPPKLIEPCILAGTSEKGECPACGKAWVRVVERETAFTSGSGKAGNVPNGKYKGTEQADSGTYDIRMGPSVSTRTTGWEPSCSCDAGDPVPQTVLDPFGGAGTTGLVADRLGRDSILIELNPEYAEIARRRITGDAPLFANVEVS